MWSWEKVFVLKKYNNRAANVEMILENKIEDTYELIYHICDSVIKIPFKEGKTPNKILFLLPTVPVY